MSRTAGRNAPTMPASTVTTPNVAFQLTGVRPGQGLSGGLGAPVASYTGTSVVNDQALAVAGRLADVVQGAGA